MRYDLPPAAKDDSPRQLDVEALGRSGKEYKISAYQLEGITTFSQPDNHLESDYQA
ncbi:MAG: hypothetical protein KJ630_10575 [Proteobacteria bacterium]|nr:hypothetical protein [Pseudomonadota bacterium]